LGRERPDLKKIKSIKEWRSPISAKGVRSLLALTNFYKKFIMDFSTLAKPFINLLKKKGSFKWETNNKVLSTS